MYWERCFEFNEARKNEETGKTICTNMHIQSYAHTQTHIHIQTNTRIQVVRCQQNNNNSRQNHTLKCVHVRMVGTYIYAWCCSKFPGQGYLRR